MPLGDFAPAGSTPRPLPIGRSLRIAFGVGASFFFLWSLIHSEEFTGGSIPDGGWWAGLGFAWWYLSDAVVVGFGRAWGRWPQAAAIVAAAVLVVISLIAYGDAWAPPVGWGALILILGMYGFFGISFLLAGALGVPG